MRPTVLGRALAIVLLMGRRFRLSLKRGFPWWKDPKVVQELALSTDQSARIDTVFRSAYPQLRQSKEELDRQEAELSRLLGINADEATVLRQVDKVEVVRGSLNKSRTLMLLHMRAGPHAQAERQIQRRVRAVPARQPAARRGRRPIPKASSDPKGRPQPGR